VLAGFDAVAVSQSLLGRHEISTRGTHHEHPLFFKKGPKAFLFMKPPIKPAFPSLLFAVTVVFQPVGWLRGDESSVAKEFPAASSPHPVTEKPLHLQVLEALRQSDSVVPPMPAVHPVSTVYNREAIVPPQCYTRTEGTFNPCYVCHQDSIPGRENVMNDVDLQTAYSFSEVGLTNHWKNLFEDRTERVAGISDAEILRYIDEDNYSELAPRLKEAAFQGWIPDLRNLHLGPAAFDHEGFARDGSQWVAFNYKPFPSTFWPANGSTDDVMIRLPESFRTDRQGQYSREIYKANLVILEANMKGRSAIGSLPIDENTVGEDLDGDGALSVVHQIRRVGAYVGAAAEIYVEPHLYPAHTEFMHTVRYVGVSPDGTIGVSKRMKEVRYMRKWKYYSKPVYARRYQLEAFEKEAGNLPGYQNLGQHGLDNGSGWSIQGFIEDRHGHLRASTYEENLFCMGCHNSIGTTVDKTFSFPRKLDGARGWTYINLRGMPDAPNQGESRGEILTYLERVGRGSEFRHNEESQARWFKADGSVDQDKVAASDVYELITPSPARALQLNKAYRTIVEDQDFIHGRDASVTPPRNVYATIDNTQTPTLPESRTFKWNILLDWPEATPLARPENVTHTAKTP
jgi:hypothetical protein